MDHLIFNKYKWINLVILKNCNTTLGEIHAIIEHNVDIHNMNRNEKYFYLVCNSFEKNIDKYNDYKKFVIYRDPLDRIKSLYKDLTIAKRIGGQEILLNILDPDLSIIDFINKYIYIDEHNFNIHCKGQYENFVKFNPDIIVHSKDLNKFVLDKFNFKNSFKTHDSSDYIKYINKDIINEFDLYKDIIYNKYGKDLDLLKIYNIYK